MLRQLLQWNNLQTDPCHKNESMISHELVYCPTLGQFPNVARTAKGLSHLL